MNCATISVALPVYNGADYLDEALETILAQDMADFELMISDNASTDATPDILAAYASKDRRVHVCRAETLLPQADNVNRAIGLCTSEWVMLFCHDDMMQSHCLCS